MLLLNKLMPSHHQPGRMIKFCRQATGAFTSSSMILAIYIQQFWDTMCFNSSTGLYSCQLDEKWFNLHKDILRDALDITPTNDNNPFVAPPSSDTVIEYVNTLGYPNKGQAGPNHSVQDEGHAGSNPGDAAGCQPQPSHVVLVRPNLEPMDLEATDASTLQNPNKLDGESTTTTYPNDIIHSSNIDYAERIWEEFVQSTQTFLTDRKNLATASRGKKKTTHLLIPSIRFTKLIIHHLKTKHNIHPRSGSPLHYSHDESILNTLMYVGKDGREIFDMPIPDALLTDEIKGAPYYSEYQEHVAKYQQHLDAEHGKAAEGGATKLVRKIRKPMSSLKLVDKPSAEDVPVEESTYNEEEANLQRALELSLNEQVERTQGPARPVTPKNKSHVDQFIFQRRTPMPTDASGPAESPSLDEIKMKARTGPNPSIQDKGQAGPNHSVQDEGHAGSNPGDAAGCQPQPSHVVLVGPNLEPMDLEATDASTLQNPKKLDGDFTDQFFMEKQQEEEPGKTNVEAEVQSMVSVLIHHDTSLIPIMTTLVIDLTTSQSGSPVSKVVDEIVTDAVDWKSSERDYSDQLLSDLEEVHQKKRKRRNVPRTPFESPPPQPPPPPPPVGASGTLASAPQSMAWTTSDTRYELAGLSVTQELSLTDSLIPDDSIPDELATPEPAWTIPSSNVSYVENNWATVLASTYVTPAENSLLAKTGDMTNFLNWYYLEYLRHGSKGSSPALSISKMKAASYPNFGIELLVPEQMWIEDVHDSPSRQKKVRSHMRILSGVRIKAYSRYGYDYLSEIVLRRADLQEYKIAEKDFKNFHPSDFEDMNLLLLQGHIDQLPGSDKRMLFTTVKLWT
nr:hypothetical protein [Tanacetum cinerariifolium]